MKNIICITISLLIALAGQDGTIAQPPAPKPTPITLAFQPNPGELHEVITEWVETENDPQANMSFGSELFSIPTAVGQTITVRKINSLWRVLDRDAKGNSVIEITYKRVRSARTFGRVVDAWATFWVKDEGYVVKWDTERKTNEINPAFAGLDQMPKNQAVEFFIRVFRDIESVRQALAKYFVDHPFRIVVDKRGRIIDVQDMDLLLDQYRTELAKLTRDFETRARQDAVVNAFLGEDAVRQSLTATQLLPFPATPVSVGQKWSDMYEFTALGKKVPVTREFSVTQSYPDYSDLLGKTTYSIASAANEKELDLLGREEISTSVDHKTGLFYELKRHGSIKVIRKPAPKNSLAVSQNDPAMRFEQKTRFNRIATRSSNDRSKWRFFGGYEDFHILLGESWYRLESNPNEPNAVVFVDGTDGASINASILAPGYFHRVRRILRVKEDIPALLEEYPKLPLPFKNSEFKMLKTFKSGDVDWYRARVDVTYEGGFVDHHIIQGGFDGARFFVFLATGWGNDFERKLAEGVAALDSIEISNR